MLSDWPGSIDLRQRMPDAPIESFPWYLLGKGIQSGCSLQSRWLLLLCNSSIPIGATCEMKKFRAKLLMIADMNFCPVVEDVVSNTNP
jgi:hypothetical protein